MTIAQEQPPLTVPYKDHRKAEYYCSTTGMTFRPLSLKYQKTEKYTFVWAWCRYCDCSRRTRADHNFDPAHPQPHCYLLTGAPS
jgi:hypothetical protein